MELGGKSETTPGVSGDSCRTDAKDLGDQRKQPLSISMDRHRTVQMTQVGIGSEPS